MPSTKQQQLHELTLPKVDVGKAVRVVDTAMVMRLVGLITLPFNKWRAYKSGVLDENGDITTPKKERTDEQKNSFTMFHKVARNIKKLISLIPFGRTILGSFAASMFLIKEMHEHPLGNPNLHEDFEQFLIDNEQIINDLYEIHFDTLETLTETTSTASVAIPSFPIDMPYKPSEFMGHKVFDVPTEKYMRSKNGKKKYSRYEKYVGSDEIGETIRMYGRKNPKKGIILRDEKSGSMIFLRKPLA